MMCDLPIVQTKFSQSDSLGNYSHYSTACDSEFQSEVLEEATLPKMSNPDEGIGGLGSCNKSSRPYKFQLEQDVQRLEQKLLEEIELHAILESMIGKSATKLSSSLCLPYNAQELLSKISEQEITVSELEQELVALHFQLSQERNERRLAEYHLRHPSPQSMSPRLSGIMKLPVSSSSRCIKHSSAEIHHSSGDESWQNRQEQSSENSGEMSSLQSVIENAVDSVALDIDMKSSRKMDRVCTQLSDFRKLPKAIPERICVYDM